MASVVNQSHTLYDLTTCNFVPNSFLQQHAIRSSQTFLWRPLSPFLILRMFGVVGEPSWFIIGRNFLREPSWEYSSNYDEAIFWVRKASLNMFWEHSPYSTNIASDWLRAELSCGGGRNTNTLSFSLASEGMFPFVDLWEAQPCLGDPE